MAASDAIGSESGDLTKEVVFETLSNRRRRYVVQYLLAGDGEAELPELATRIAALENDKEPGAVSGQERHRVYNALQQAHLPKMDEAGLIEFDADRGTVAASEALADLRVYLEIVPGREIPWSQYYLLLGLFCSVLVLAAALEVFPFGVVPGVALAGVVAGLVTASGIAHVYYSRRMHLDVTALPGLDE